MPGRVIVTDNMMKKMILTGVLFLPLLVACGEGNDRSATRTESESERVAVNRQIDFAEVSRGAKLYQKNCAECHGSVGQGAPDWRQRGADGMFPPPPLNGTGHAWHHPRRMLHHVIANGSPGGGNMPAWGDKLSDEDIGAIISWFQSKWPDQVYAAWERMDRQSREGS